MGNGMLSQEEIDALLRGTVEVDAETENLQPGNNLEDMEKDTLGEIANISMGTAATTLSLLLNKKVEITTPKVDVTTSQQIREEYPIPSVICDVRYKAGIEGSNLLILSQRDASVIVDLMMGGDGKNPSAELSELQISGVSEAMNQMMGSAATSMSTMFNSMVDITPPSLVLNDLSQDRDVIQDFLSPSDPLVRISFRMVVEDVIDSTLIQVIPVDMAKRMVDKLMGVMTSGPAQAAGAKEAAPALETPQIPTPTLAPSAAYQSPPPAAAYQTPPPSAAYQSPPPPAYETPPYAASSMGYPPPPYGNMPGNSYSGFQTPVQPAQFAPLQPGQPMGQHDNLNLILDVPLQISVELGRAKKTIKEILEMGPGSVIELDRLAGEPVDMIVNGKLIAKCEVVVVNETFGIRITDIVHPMERMNTLN
ncbi:flagellar motor switch phosphatase FliY [Desulfosporosinus sp. PR]|uniref:flagellar motor switch phosphatase FliY n=1 Tax=Candidatus Desulfosporosinus nitrosoreducens TaxID=3401928 RepID=UPI0027F1501B|nr:flagellar motor switch phosphatase FliY [Desulfosporosinus sp. PR]MDQ7096229.1 flagellar motor switch phosphatase FliY [Desulfosporosinus sp. PR]